MRKYQLKLNDKDFNVHLRDLSGEEATLEINGKEYQVEISSVSEVIPEGVAPSAAPPPSGPVASPASVAKAKSGDTAAGSVQAPIPGSIMEVYVQVGDSVKAGQPLFKMEAMKMENEINSRLDGTVSAVNISAGDSVNQGDELMVINP
ncbi:Biotin-requiring enzyme [Malonomonas rubra DSM 5091]|uniref:Biotin-requiring enzyme n=1 Tax=Malonomonas rubra DSM 5091 TaxID=1122189 RepID=A0A1M6G7C6_MALRU|nr:biotin/lipoyl-containing protein [Malonomonas rubra]SHJ05878.1 Biotin-requiring enzyme [Malonomonas rubra DSM 5091]